MTTTDTRAALDAAILKYGGDAATSYEFHARPPDDRDLNAAITAHVEAEVARRLAVAPSVEEAIEAHGDACYERGHVHAGGLPDDSVRSIDRDAAEATLRAAIAADRERAVAEATDGAVQGERFAAAICRLVGARETGTGGQTVDACTASLYADAAKRIDRMIARDKARPTPDEARRMINELIGSMAVVGNGLDDSPGVVVAKRIAADARAALLRALGVEA